MVSEYKYLVRWTAQYKKDVKLAKRRHYDIAELEAVIKNYSYPASASTGSSFAARLAGFRPKNTPTNTLNTNDTTHAPA